jgi:hypothetical protein
LGADLLRDSKTLGPADGSLVHPREVLDRLGVVAQVLFAGDEDDRQSLAKVEDLGDPLRWVSRCGWRRLQELLSRTFSWTLSSESGESMAKQMRMTCESG